VQDSIKTRLAVAAPVSVLVSMLVVGVVGAFFNDSPMAPPTVLLAGPTLCAIWVFSGWSRLQKLGMAFAAVGITAVMYIVVLALFLSMFQDEGGYLSSGGVYVEVYAPLVLLVVGSLVLRTRSSAPTFGAWLLWYVPIAVVFVWGAVTKKVATDFGMDATASSLVYELSASWGLCTWVGLLAAAGIGHGMKWSPERVT